MSGWGGRTCGERGGGLYDGNWKRDPAVLNGAEVRATVSLVCSRVEEVDPLKACSAEEKKDVGVFTLLLARRVEV